MTARSILLQNTRSIARLDSLGNAAVGARHVCRVFGFVHKVGQYVGWIKMRVSYDVLYDNTTYVTRLSYVLLYDVLCVAFFTTYSYWPTLFVHDVEARISP